jgi:hypothetical protein
MSMASGQGVGIWTVIGALDPCAERNSMELLLQPVAIPTAMTGASVGRRRSGPVCTESMRPAPPPEHK